MGREGGAKEPSRRGVDARDAGGAQLFVQCWQIFRDNFFPAFRERRCLDPDFAHGRFDAVGRRRVSALNVFE